MMSENNPLLTVSELSVSYGAIAALRGASLEVARGEAVAILGANGAGKTTLLKALSGVQSTRAGSVVFDGREVLKQKPSKLVSRGIAHVPEGRQVFSRLTVQENLRLGAFAHHRGKLPVNEVEAVFDLFPRLAERVSQVAGTLSGGEQQMLAIGRAMLSRPKMLLLDEPSMGLAPIVVDQIFTALGRINRETDMSLLIVEQNARAALKLATRGYLLESGEIVASGPSEQLSASAIEAAYLGTYVGE